MLPATSDRPLTGAEQAAVRQKEWVERRRAEAALQQKEEEEAALQQKRRKRRKDPEEEERHRAAARERYRGLSASEKREYGEKCAAYRERHFGLPGSEKRAAYNAAYIERYRGLPGSEKRARRMRPRARAQDEGINCSDPVFDVPIGGTPLESATKGHAARKRPDGFTEVTMPDGTKHCVGSEGDEKWHRHRKAELERLREEAINEQTIKLGKGPSIFVRLGSKDGEGSDITRELLDEFKSEVAKAIRAEAKFFVVLIRELNS